MSRDLAFDLNGADEIGDPKQRELRRWKHRSALFWSLLVLSAALMLRIGEDGRVVVPIVRWSLPGVCFWQRLWQLDCPGCGMTRCFIALAHADVAGAWRYNPAGLLLFAALLVQFPYRWVQLRRIARREPEIGVGRPVLLAWIAVAAIIGQWVARMFLF